MGPRYRMRSRPPEVAAQLMSMRKFCFFCSSYLVDTIFSYQPPVNYILNPLPLKFILVLGIKLFNR